MPGLLFRPLELVRFLGDPLESVGRWRREMEVERERWRGRGREGDGGREGGVRKR